MPRDQRTFNYVAIAMVRAGSAPDSSGRTIPYQGSHRPHGSGWLHAFGEVMEWRETPLGI